MEPILSKQEIADLLSTLQHSEPVRVTGADSVAPGSYSGYNEIDLFKRPGARSEQATIPNFDLIMDLFAEYYASALSQSLQCTISVTATGVAYQRLNTFLTSQPSTCAIGVIKAEPLHHCGLITFNSRLAFSMIELLLGGSTGSDRVQPERSPTRMELSILESLLEHGCNCFQQAIFPVVQTTASLVKTTHDLRLVSLAGPEAELVVCTLQVEIGEFSDSMQLVFPAQTFAPFKQPLENLLQMDEFDENWGTPLASNLESMACTLMARSNVIEMTIRDFISLKTGDLIPLNRKPDGIMDLLVEGKKKFSGIQVVQDQKRHIRLIDTIDNSL